MDHNGLGQRPSLPGKTVVPGQSSIYSSGPLNLSKSKSLDLIQNDNNLDTTFETFNLTMPPDMNHHLHHHQQQQPPSPDISLGLLPPQVKQATAAREKALQKMLNRVPFNVREDVTALVTMSVTLAESAQYNLNLTRQDLVKLKTELRKKTIEAENLRKSCEIFRERIRVTEDTIMQTKDALNVKQKFEVKSRRSVTRLAANNRMLIESLEALNVSSSSKNNTKKLVHGDDGGGSRPRSPMLLPISRESERINDDNSESTEGDNKVDDHNEKGVSSDKLRTSLLRVAREHYKKVKYVELLEEKMEELRSNLMNSERLNRKLKSEIDDLKSLQAGSQVLSTASIEKTENKKEEKDQKKNEEIDRTKKPKKTVDEKFKQMLAREGADYTEVLLQYKRIASYFSQAPLAFTIDEVGQYLGSSEAIKAFDVEMVAVFILDGPNKDKALKYTTRSPHPETCSLKDVRSIASDVIKTGKVVRLNNLHRVLSFRQEIDGTPCTITRRILSLPIRSLEDKNVTLGAIHLTNCTGAQGFTEVDEIAAQIFASYAGTLIDMCRHREATLNSNDLLSNLLDSPIHLYNIVPDSTSFASTKGLNVGEILHSLEEISMSSLKCLKCRAYLASDRIDGAPGYMTYLEPSFGTSVKPGNLTTQSIYTGIAGYVLQKKEQFIYDFSDDNSHAKLNPQVDLSPLEHTMVTVPVLDNDNKIIGCLQFILGPKSPTIAGSRGEKMHFRLAAHWLSHQISAPLQFAIKSLSSPVTRDLSLPLPTSPLGTPTSTSRKGLNSPKTPDNSRKRDKSSLQSSSSMIPVAVFEQLQSVHIQTQTDLEACREKLAELGNIVEKLTVSEIELKERLQQKSESMEKLEAELLTVMESEAAVKDSLDGFLEKQKKRRDSHLASAKHSHQLTEEEADDEYIEKRVNMVEIKYKDLIKTLEQQIHELTLSLTKEHHHESMIINEKNEKIESLELELAELKVQIASHRDDKTNDDTVTTLESKIAELKETIHIMSKDKADDESTINSLTNDAKKFTEMIAQRDLIIESMNDTHDNTNNNENDDNEIKKLKDVITQKDDVIKILQDQISKLAQNMAVEGATKKAKKSKEERKSFADNANTNNVDWIEALDENGNKYWYNVSTGQTSWNNPATSGLGQARVIGDWSENFDEHGNSYWINMVTGESSWELPA